MARSAADLALELSVAAGPDELTGGTAYKRPLPPPRHDRLADFRVLVIDKHPLCPTAESITTALNRLVDRLAKLEVRIVRENPRLPDLAQGSRVPHAAIAATCASVWVRAFFAYGISRSMAQRSTLSAGHGL